MAARSEVYVLGGYQTDFARNWTKENKHFSALMREGVRGALERCDIAPEEVMVEIAGQEKKVEAFIDLMRPFGIVELVRTGRIAMVRSVDRTGHQGTGLRKFAAVEQHHQ